MAALQAAAANVADQVIDLFMPLSEFDRLKAREGASGAAFQSLLARHGARFAPFAAHGLMAEPSSERAGILVVPVRDGDLTVVERLAVLSDEVRMVAADGGEGATRTEQRYFIKGYGDRIVGFAALDALLTGLKEAATSALAPRDGTMETALRSGLRALSEQAVLWARRTEREADTPTMPADVLVPTPLPAIQRWANNEVLLPDGAGPLDSAGFRPIALNYDAIEGRLLIFKCEALQRRRNARGQALSGQVGGAILAQIQGIAGMEIMGPVGEYPGVKNASARALVARLAEALQRRPVTPSDAEQQGSARAEVVMRITTQDNAVHELKVGDKGVTMSLIGPRPHSPANGLCVGLGADLHAFEEAPVLVDVYSYHGHNTGPQGSMDGFATPKLVMSTQEEIAAETMLQRPGASAALLRVALRAITANPALGGNRSLIASAANTLIRSVTKAAYVAASSAALQAVQDASDSGTLLGGRNRFSGNGGGKVDAAKMFQVILFTVLAQEGLSLVYGLLSKIVPEHIHRPETVRGEVALHGGAGALQELLRQQANYWIQLGLGLDRGGAADLAMQAAHSVVSSGIDLLAAHSGRAENHPHLGLAADASKCISDLLFRSYGNMRSHPAYTPDTALTDYGEAFLARLSTRGGDRLALPVVIGLLNQFGIVGHTASAYTHGLSRDARYGGALRSLRMLADDVAVRGWHAQAAFADVAAVRQFLFMITDALDRIKRSLNRVGLRPAPANSEDIAMVRASGGFAAMSEPQKAAYLRQLETRFTEERLDAFDLLRCLQAAHDEAAHDEAAPAPAGPPPTSARAITTSRAELPPTLARTMRRLEQARNDPQVLYGTKVGLDNRTWPVFAHPRILRGSHKLKREATTWSREAQNLALAIHRAMEPFDGLAAMAGNAKGALSPDMVKTILSHFIGYTKKSGPRHYALRWNETGAIQHYEIVKGVWGTRMVMVQPGNTSGPALTERSGGDEYVRPLGALYMNLGMHFADRFPSLAQRAVVTEAPYVSQALEAPSERRTKITEGDVVGLSEIFSMTQSSGLAAAFGQALGYDSAPREHSQRLRIFQQTGVVTRDSDLAQAEVIMTPGALFMVELIDANAGRAPAGAGEEPEPDIAQVVYQAQIDTYALERRYRDWEAGTTMNLEHGALLIHPDTGFFHRWDEPNSNAVEERSATRSYFLGGAFEYTGKEEVARWKFPFTSDKSPRATKDDIHFAILSHDPIVPHLDLATSNCHHAYFRTRSANTNANAAADAAADQQRRATLREHAGMIVALLPTATDTTLGLPGIGLAPVAKGARSAPACPTELLTWLMVSLLRQPVQLIDVDSPASWPLMRTTYDRVELDAEQVALVGVGRDGFYAVRVNRAGERELNRVGGGMGAVHTAGHLLHAICYASAHCRLGYQATGGWLVPDRQAEQSIAQLLAKARAFAATDYVLLQQKLVATAKQLGWKAPARRDSTRRRAAPLAGPSGQ